MGASLQYQHSTTTAHQAHHGKLKFTLNINQYELSILKQIIRQRSNFQHPYLCTVHKFITQQDSSGNIFCETFNQVAIEYEQFDFILADVKQNYPINQHEIQRIIYSVARALLFLEEKKYRHGDISAKAICKYKNQWRLIDSYFIRGGITAYEKVLEGEVGYISPAQMEKIRHGFVKESPIIQQSDDVFALGMTCLQLMSGKPATFCYKQSFIRFNDKNLGQVLSIVSKTYHKGLVSLIVEMINFNEQQRIPLRQILKVEMINRHGKKFSLKYHGNAE